MGCDIHEIIERKGEFCWLNSGSPDLHRDYELFAVLAGVRNKYGIIPVSLPKGKPTDDNEFCSEFNALLEQWNGDAHSTSWVTLEELKAFDLSQEFYDGRLILSKNENGNITSTCEATNGKHLGPVGKRKVFSTWGTAHWDYLISYMENVKSFHKLKDSEVRLSFFFDNQLINAWHALCYTAILNTFLFQSLEKFLIVEVKRKQNTRVFYCSLLKR